MGEYQFADIGKLTHALYKFYQKGKLPKNKYVLECFKLTLSWVEERIMLHEDSESERFHEALVNEGEKIRKILEEMEVSTELQLISKK